jgi:hypothetical protein
MTKSLAQDDRFTGGVVNIIATYRRATEAERVEGADWYRKAGRLAAEIHPNGAAIIAALSPQKAWDINLIAARELVATGDTKWAIEANKIKARRIIAGERPDDVLRGPKVRAFWKAIEGQGGAVVMDRHALGVYVGLRPNKTSMRVLERRGAYQYLANAYRRAARIIGIDAQSLQAITWVVWRKGTASA